MDAMEENLTIDEISLIGTALKGLGKLGAGFGLLRLQIECLICGRGHWRLRRFRLCQINSSSLAHHVKMIAILTKPFIKKRARVFLVHKSLYALDEVEVIKDKPLTRSFVLRII